MQQARIGLCPQDPIASAGLVGSLEVRTGVTVLDPVRQHRPEVVFAAFDRLASVMVGALRVTADVVVRDQAGSAEVPAPIERRVIALLPRAAAMDGRLVKQVHAAPNDDGTGAGRAPRNSWSNARRLPTLRTLLCRVHGKPLPGASRRMACMPENVSELCSAAA